MQRTRTLAAVFVLSAFTLCGCRKQVSTGADAVRYLYEFNDPAEIERNTERLRDIVTPQVFDELTVDEEGRRLSTYLKFSGAPVTVDIVEETDDHVLYRIKNEYIDNGRLFLFMFRVDSGKISKIREVEVIDFVDTDD